MFISMVAFLCIALHQVLITVFTLGQTNHSKVISTKPNRLCVKAPLKIHELQPGPLLTKNQPFLDTTLVKR